MLVLCVINEQHPTCVVPSSDIILVTPLATSRKCTKALLPEGVILLAYRNLKSTLRSVVGQIIFIPGTNEIALGSGSLARAFTPFKVACT